MDFLLMNENIVLWLCKSNRFVTYLIPAILPLFCRLMENLSPQSPYTQNKTTEDKPLGLTVSMQNLIV